MSNQRFEERSDVQPPDDGVTVLLVAASGVVDGLATGLQRDIEHVLPASSIDDALAVLEDATVDCVVSELELDEGDGLALMDGVRERYPALPFVLWTDAGDEAVASEVIAAGVSDYVPRREGGLLEFESVAERVRRLVATHDTGSARDGRDLKLIADLNQSLARAETIDEGLDVVLTDVCEATAWVYGELWVPNSSRDELEHAKSYVLNDEFRPFVRVTRTTTFQKGEGLPGRVWATEDTEWIRDVSDLSPEKYIRTEIADDTNFKAAFGIPVNVGGRVEAVLAYYATEPRTFSADMAAVVETLAATFGRLIRNEQAETQVADAKRQRRYTAPVETVSAATAELQRADAPGSMAQTVVDAAAELLDASVAVAYVYDEDAGELVPAAASDEYDAEVDDLPRVSPGETIVWQGFAERERKRVDDVGVVDTVPGSRASVRGLLVPLGERGVVVVGDADPEPHDRFCIQLLEVLCAIAGETLARCDRTEELEHRRRELQRRTHSLEQSRRLADELRTTMTAIAEADSHAGIARAACTALTALDRIDGAWIGEPNPERDELRVVFQAGVPESYLQTVPLGLETDNSLPAARATRDQAVTVEENVAEKPQSGGWRRTALLYEFQSIVSVPIRYENVLYGVLTAISSEPDRYDDATRSTLEGIGSLVGWAFNAVDRRNALLDDETVTLTLEFAGTDDVFNWLASRTRSEINLENVSVRPDGGYLVHFEAGESDPDDLTTYLAEHPAVQRSRLLSGGESPVVEAVVVGDCVATTVAGLGADVHQVTATEQGSRIDLSIPRRRDKQRFLGQVTEEYPDAELKAHASRPPSSPSLSAMVDRQLTDRQHEILKAAYHGGFFEQPRESTGKEIAQSLGISQPAFSTQLRTIQKKLVESMYEND